jgi:hypothetical protein
MIELGEQSKMSTYQQLVYSQLTRIEQRHFPVFSLRFCIFQFAIVNMQKEIAKDFMVTAVIFHDNFNFRDLSKTFQHCLRTIPTVVKSPTI